MHHPSTSITAGDAEFPYVGDRVAEFSLAQDCNVVLWTANTSPKRYLSPTAGDRVKGPSLKGAAP